MNVFSKNNPDNYTFYFWEKEEQSIFNVEAEPFGALSSSYLFLGENKNQDLFCSKQEIDEDDKKFLYPSDKCASHELLNKDWELDNSFVWFEYKTSNIALKSLDIDSKFNISEYGDQDSPNKFKVHKDQDDIWSKPYIEGQDNPTTQIHSDKLEINNKFIQSPFPLLMKRGPRRKKFSRWDKEDDKRLYGVLLNLIDTNQISRKFIDNIDDVNEISDYEELKIISSIVKWKNPFNYLIKRIRKILTSDKLTAREIVALRRIVRSKYSSNHIDYNHLMKEFPGKSKDTLRIECEKTIKRSAA